MVSSRTAVKIAVVGGGKMGLPLACMFARRGACVTVCDINPNIVASISQGIDPHNEPEQGRLVRDAVANGRLRATTDTSAAVVESDAVIILVAAHLSDDSDIDWTSLSIASEAVARGLRRGTLVSYETTLPVGGCRGTLVPILERSGLQAGSDFPVVFSPERVKSRLVFERLSETPKVVGGIDAASAAAGQAFYRRWLGAPVINVGSLEAAEFVKLAGMVYRDVNIALVNELATFAEVSGLDIWPLLEAANTDGETALLRPGIGVGGHCTPVYPHFLMKGAARLGLQQELVTAGREINARQPVRQAQRLAIALGGLARSRVHILGLAFRPQVREDAYSPAYALRDALTGAGAQVTLEDPLFSEDELRVRGFAHACIGKDPIDAVVLNTAHPEFASPSFPAWRKAGVKAVLDGRAAWQREAVETAGLLYVGVGIARDPTCGSIGANLSALLP
jgi:nucleotide sugar dehydrogenase